MDHLEDQVLKATDFLKALANPHRLMILCLLRDDEFAVSELEKRLSLRQPTLSQQLARLREDNLVATRRDGKQIYYRLASDEVRRTIALLDDMFRSGALEAGEREGRGSPQLEDAH